MSYDLDQSLVFTAFKHNPVIIFVSGKPLSSRSLICNKIVKEFGYTHISISNLFKDEVKKASSFGDDVKFHLEKGELVPTKMVLYALVHAIQENKSEK
jgi:adenylate kinase family enzyme